MNILFVNFPYAGHTLPTLPIVEKLIKNGHSVTYINHEKWRDKIISLGATFVPYDYYPKKPLLIDGVDTDAFQAMYNTANRLIKDYDILAYEFFFFQGNALAKKAGVPAIRFCSQHAYSDNVTKELIDNYKTWQLSNIPGISKLITIILNRNIPLKINDFWKAMMHDYPDLNIVFTCEDFQLYNEEFDKDKFKFIGSSANNDYVNSQAYKDYSIGFLKKNNINQDKFLIYISMGTLVNGTYKFLQKCIKAFSDKNINVIISAGNKAEKLKKFNVSDNIHIFNFVPQLEILNHTDLFITHGGMNSVDESMFLGVPMLVIPVAFDQPTNAKLVEQYKMGLKGNLKKITSDEIWEKSNYILNNLEIQSNIKEWQQKQINAGGVQRAVDEIEKYFRRITEK